MYHKIFGQKIYLCRLNSLCLRHFLFIDHGNTALKGLLTDAEFRSVHTFTVSAADFLAERDRLLPYEHIAGGLYASVGELSPALRETLELTYGLQAFSSALRIPLGMGYDTPETLGPDRLATAIGGHALYPGHDVLVLDFGTCLKFDFVNRDARYEGGSISPGLNMRFKAMHTFTAKLPLLTRPKKFPTSPIGRSTAQSMENGVLLGMLSEAERMIARYRESYPELTVLATGGDAEVFGSHLKNVIFVQQNLALLGLAETMKYHANTPNE